MADEQGNLSVTAQALIPTTITSRRLGERQAETEHVTALILGDLYQNPEHYSDEGLMRLTARNRALAAAGSNEEILRSVALQAAALEALFHRYVLLAQDPKLAPAVVETFMRVALSAERVFLRAVAVLATVKTMSNKPI